jgi:hypothetical protein
MDSTADLERVVGAVLDPTPFDLDFVRRTARSLDCLDVLEAIERESLES